MQQITKMFATLGFNIDTSGLVQFKAALKEARADTALLARNARVLTDSLNQVNRALVRVNGNLKIKKSDNKLSATYVDLKNAVEKVDKAFLSITKNQKTTTQSLGKIHGSLVYGEQRWKAYGDQVQRTKDLLKGANEKIKELRNNASVNAKVNISQKTSTVTGRNQGNAPRQGGTTVIPFSGFGGRRGESPWLGSIAPFFRSMAPATAIGGGLAAGGFAAKEVITRGRDMQKMENIMTAATDSNADFVKSMEYVRKESDRLGQSTKEMGMGFAKVLQSAQGKMSLEKTQKLFTGLGELMTVFGSNAEDQQGVYRALGQMLSKGKVEAEEVGQMAERGLSREIFRQAAVRTYGIKDTDYDKFQKAGKVKIPEIADELAKITSDMARKNGALDKALNTSLVSQQRLMNNIDTLSKNILQGGLDTALKGLFEGLNSLVLALNDVGSGIKFVITGWKELKKLLDEATDGNGALAIILGVVSLLLLRKGKLIVSLIKNVKNLRGIWVAFRAFLSGGLMRAIIAIGKRFFWWITILGILWKVGKAVNQGMQGQTTWIDVWGEKIKGLGLWFDILGLKMKLAFYNAKNMVANPIDTFMNRNNPWSSGEYFGGTGDVRNTKIVRPNLMSPEQRNPPQQYQAPPLLRRPNAMPENGGDLTKKALDKVLSATKPINIYLDNKLTARGELDFLGNATVLELVG
jgi:tape measure domain